MAYPFPNHLETFTQPNHQNLQSLTSIFLNWNSPATGINPNDDSSFSSSPGSNNSNQRSPSTPTFPNYQVPTRIGFMSNTSINSFYFNPSDDWMSWKEYNQREFSSSPTGISNTTPNTPSAIYLKTETTLPSTSESISLGMMNNSNLNHSDNMMENGFMTNPVYCDTPETFLRLQNQHLLAELPLHNQGDVCPYSLTYSPDMGLNLVEPDGQYKHESYNPRNTPSSLRIDVLGEDTTSSFTLSSHQQLQENAVDLQSEGIEEAHTEEYILPAINQSDSDSNCDVNPDHISKSPPSQANLGVNSSNFVDLESPVKKRKFNYAIDDEETQYPSTHGLIHDPYPNKSSSIRETVNHKGVHTNGLTRPPKKTAHNMIEKRYRTNLNEKIAALRDAVPSLRIVVRCGGGLIRQSSKNSNKARKDEQKTSRLTRVARKDTVDRSDIERDDLQGLTAASKLNKATILAKATEYIAHLEHRNHALLEERETLRCRIDALEKLGHSIQAGESSKARAQRSMDY